MAKVHISQCDIKYYDETTSTYITPRFDSTADPYDISAVITADQLINLISLAHDEGGGLTKSQVKKLVDSIIDDETIENLLVTMALKRASQVTEGAANAVFKAAASMWKEVSRW